MAFYDEVHSVKKFRYHTEAKDAAGNKWIYLKGISSLVAGDAVTFDENGVTALLAANAKGPVAIAGADVDANTKYGWFGRSGVFTANGAASSSDNALVGREGADGKLGDGRTAGDEIYNCIARSATSSAGDMTVQMYNPFVDDANGS